MSRTISFRAFCESPKYLRCLPSPLMAAVWDASQGIRPTSISDAESIEHFGCALADLPARPHRTIVIRAGMRGRKTSGMGAPAALYCAWTVPAPDLGRGEVASVPITAPDLDLARQALSFVSGYVDASPILRAARTHEDSDSITMRRPLDNREVRIEVRAAARGGRTGRGRTLLGAVLDEAALFRDADTGAVNDLEIHRAVAPRIVPGGWEWIISTPWIAHQGLLESYLDKNFANHTHALVAVGGTRAFNPAWDPTGEIESDLREQDPENAAREIDAIPMSGGSGSFFDAQAITAAVNASRPIELPHDAGATYASAADFAFRRDSSAFVCVERRGDRVSVALVDELRPSAGAPLKPSAVVAHFAKQAQRYSCGAVAADGHYVEAVREHLDAVRLALTATPEGAAGKAEMFTRTRTLLHEGRLELPNHPRLIRQLRDVVSKPLPGGTVAITSPRSVSGGHGDLVSALCAAVWSALSAGSTWTSDANMAFARSVGFSAPYVPRPLDGGSGGGRTWFMNSADKLAADDDEKPPGIGGGW